MRSERSRELLAVLIVDLDGFKQVNDSLGHDAGDRLLQEVSRRFDEATRPFTFAASISALAFGRDEADYSRRLSLRRHCCVPF